ncbi:aminodeoxychorismate synthase [Xylaria bambusicola]|uniref:aminodeoxychorismate synthase n=1 Tax=Xylaria bambusicola TaxID=326684 RepID=UPI0020087B86|nr:aminodeoxychorismate synthase [Xylaria bambusicola]KAI0517644.1 aminodeoxychorismate synthase [Xylaria bambusicola]
MGRPRILFIDAYDSFSNNIVSLLTTVLGADVDVLHIDPPHLSPEKAGFKQLLSKQIRPYHAVVCGPGPGAPDVDKDVGIMKHIWALEGQDLPPVLGICLGFQSLVVSCGAVVKRLQTGLHGMIRQIDHLKTKDNANIFADVPTFKATLYHSLHADVGQQSISAPEWQTAKWDSPPLFPDVVPLAWTYEDRGDAVERILMGVRHRSKPFWGLQYHPESICTESIGHQVIKNWFQEAMAWNHATGRNPKSVIPETTISERLETSTIARNSPVDNRSSRVGDDGILSSFGLGAQYLSHSIDIPLHIEVPDVVEILQDGKNEFIVLDSASAKIRRTGLDVRGRYSIIALDVDEAVKLEYRTGSGRVIIRGGSPASSTGGDTIEKVNLDPSRTIWQFLADIWSKRQIQSRDTPDPFIGGFMGYTTYELGLEGINVELHKERRHSRPDLCFAWVTRSIVIDHLEGVLRIQNLSSSEADGQQWLESIADKLVSSPTWSNALAGSNFDGKAHQSNQLTPPHTPTSGHMAPEISVPAASEYESKVRLCQEYIAAGDSYELCLTDQTLITQARSRFEGALLPRTHDNKKPSFSSSSPSSWQLYRSLRTRQPAPFGSYMRLGGATLVSSSPERFLTFDSGGLCSMRPMKGTVRKSPLVSTLAAAEKVLHVPKEEAENLMIVDLVRHDLHSVCGPGNVDVPHLLKVEEYASVFQMISVVEGRLPRPSSHDNHGDDGKEPRLTGLDVLAASLPPGSMTGAPKKRSCEILQTLEGPRGSERSLYSGVVGYMDVAGRGDWSVTIRSLFRWDDEITSTTSASISALEGTGGKESAMETWHIGAGGAVTALSTPEGETDEMFTKLKGPVGVFEEA